MHREAFGQELDSLVHTTPLPSGTKSLQKNNETISIIFLFICSAVDRLVLEDERRAQNTHNSTSKTILGSALRALQANFFSVIELIRDKEDRHSLCGKPKQSPREEVTTTPSYLI